ncbi:MAG TPA: hypothetical protein DCO71_04640 [Gammaproteobacteria bacterium]|nr:hypothetical protein [Gammaproteobacteria bacterium]
MKPTLFLLGPSDIEGQSWTKKEHLKNGNVKGTAQWSGFLPIQPFVMADTTLNANSTFVLIGIHESLKVPKDARLNLFNLVGDADASVTTLNTIQALENNIQPLRCFNRASNVFRTSRGILPETLSNIPGCHVPRIIASDPKSYSEFETACENFSAWPLIVRARGYHGGDHMILLTDRSQLEAFKDNQWLYDGIFLMEFIDYRNEGSLYQKSRILFVDGVPYPRHSIISDRWSIHSGSRADLMAGDIELCRQEEHFLAYLRDTGLQEYDEVFSTIQERVGLDIFGVDFALVDGQVLVFEANACMNFLNQDYGADGRYRYLESHIKALKHAVKKMLMRA